jgi:hypothetical protein
LLGDNLATTRKSEAKMPPTIYFDTNVFRYFATAFRDDPIDADLRDYFAISPFSLLELISQLATTGAQEAFVAIHTMLNVYKLENTGILPWPEEVFRVLIFGASPEQGDLAKLLNTATQNVLNANSPADVEAEARELREFLNKVKYGTAENFAHLLTSWRNDGALEDGEHRRIFAESIAHRAGVSKENVKVDSIIEKLNAYWEYESTRLEIAGNEPEYNPHTHEHENDTFDAEQLVYLAHPDLHFLTSDGGFRKASASAQYTRIHRAPQNVFVDHKLAIDLIRSVVQGASTSGQA